MGVVHLLSLPPALTPQQPALEKPLYALTTLWVFSDTKVTLLAVTKSYSVSVCVCVHVWYVCAHV